MNDRKWVHTTKGEVMKVMRVLLYEGSEEFIRQQFDRCGVRPGGKIVVNSNCIKEVAATWPSRWCANAILPTNTEGGH